MSFDLVVLATAGAATLDDVRAMADRSVGRPRVEGEPDPRIAAFYADLRAGAADDLTDDGESPWVTPVVVGVDHVALSIAHSPVGDDAVDLVLRLAEKHGLVVYDPQGDEATGLSGDYADPAAPDEHRMTDQHRWGAE
ncbi:hypothetical protein O7635_22205 [Asanoa sp. WMMD1127]|uniref:hypothetical protein n=1 Tax=Asanoa sp. WMMD1127 TaxID=3016107 RepID=UPI002417A4B1|nr:hypothetical protein [Asanoa sp. WMMD1127]MDG4824571.1 hypothetical protein [Asanoa sp. WMMD1127]